MSAYLAIDPLRFDVGAAWLDDAPCAGAWDLFDIPVYRDIAEAFRAAEPALEVCARCPFTRECMTRVDPAGSLFDGVAAGRLWRNGAVAKRPAKRRKPGPARTAKCGTRSGYESHRRNGEVPCRACTDAKSAYSAAYERRRAAGRPVEVDLLAIKDAAIHRCDCGAWRFANQDCTTCTHLVSEAS